MSLQVMANTPQECAQQKGATARRLIGELAPLKRQLVIALGLIVISAGAQAGGPYLIGRAIDRYIVPGNRTGLAQTMLVLLGVYVVGALATRGQIFQVGSTGQRVLANIRARLFDQFQHVPLGYFDRRPVGDLISRATNDVETLSNLLTQGLPQLLGSLFGLIGIVIAMLLGNVQLALIAFTVIPAILLVTTYFGRRSRRVFRKARETTGDVPPRCKKTSSACAKHKPSTAPKPTSASSSAATPPTATPTSRRSASRRRSRRRWICSTR